MKSFVTFFFVFEALIYAFNAIKLNVMSYYPTLYYFFYNFIGFEEKFNINYKTNRKAIIVGILRVMSYI